MQIRKAPMAHEDLKGFGNRGGEGVAEGLTLMKVAKRCW